MEELDVNGDVTEQPTLTDSTANETKERFVNGNDDAFISESDPSPIKTTFVLKTTVEERREEEISHGGDELEDEKKSTFIMRSRPSVEEYSNNVESTGKTVESSSSKPLNLASSSHSTDETADCEKTENKEDKPTEMDRSHDNMTQVIAAQAAEIVRSVLERLENEIKNGLQLEPEQINQQGVLSVAVQRSHEARTEAFSETTEEDQVDNSKAAVGTYSDREDKSFGEQLQTTDEGVTIETVSPLVIDETTQKFDVTDHVHQSIACDTSQEEIDGKDGSEDKENQHPEDKEDSTALDAGIIREKEEKEEVMEMEIKKKDEKSFEEHHVSSETSIQETPPDELAIDGAVAKLDGEQMVGVKALTTEEEGDILPSVQHDKQNEENEEKAETFAMNFMSQEEQTDKQKLVTLESGQGGTLLAEEVNVKCNAEQGEIETNAKKLNEEQCEEQRLDVAETTESEAVKPLPEGIEPQEIEFKSNENKSEKMGMRFETFEEKSDDQILLEVETSEMKLPTDKDENEESELKLYESNLETIAMEFETPEENSDDQMLLEIEKTDVKSLREEDKHQESEFKSNECKSEASAALDFETPEEKPEEQMFFEQEKNELKSLQGEDKHEESEFISNERKSETTLVMEFEKPEEKSDDQMFVEVEKTEVKSLQEEDKHQESEFISNERKSEIAAMEFETLEIETTAVKSLPDSESTHDGEKAQDTTMISETQREEFDEAKIATASKSDIALTREDKSGESQLNPDDEESKATATITTNGEEANFKEEIFAKEGTDEAHALLEVTSMPLEESKAETMSIKVESKEEQSDEQTVVIAEKKENVSDEITEDQIKKDFEILSMKFESKDEKSDEEQLAFAEATAVQLKVKPEIKYKDVDVKTISTVGELPQEIRQVDGEKVEETNNEHGTKDDFTIYPSLTAEEVSSAAIEEQEEPSSPKQEYVAEHFRQNTQSLYEIQEGNEANQDDVDKPEEKPIVKVRLAEEPLNTAANESQYDNDVIELDDQVLESPAEVPLDTFKDESDSDGEIDVIVERLSQENEQLIKEGGSDEESTPDDWMAKDDTDEIVFKGKAVLVIDVEDTKLNENEDQQTSETIETQRNVNDGIIVADTKAITVCSDIGGLFPPGEQTQIQTTETPKLSPEPEYDIDKEIEEETQRLISKNRVVIDDNSMTVMEEILPNQQIKKEKTELNILLVNEKEQETVDEKEVEEEKPPSPVEAKKVTEEGITEIFETEELRRSGIFDDTLNEEDEEPIRDQCKISQKDVVLANEEYFEAKQKEKHSSLRWSLLEKWEEMNKKQSLEIKETETNAIVPTGPTEDDTQGQQPSVTEYEIRETDKPVVLETVQTVTTPSSITTVKTTKTVMTTRVTKARSEVQPQTMQDEQAVSQEVEQPQDSILQPLQLESLQSEQETEPAFKDTLPSSQHVAEEDKTQDGNTESLQTQPCDDVREDALLTPEEAKKAPQEEPPSAAPQQALPMSTILFRMDGTPVIIPPVEQEPKRQTEEKKEEQPTQPPIRTEETETKGKPSETGQMSTILFRMDGTPFVVPAAPQKSSPKVKSVNFSTETTVRPLSATSVESMRGEKEGVPPLAGGEESDIDDSTQHLANQAYSAPSRVPTVSPVEEVSAPPSPRPNHDYDEKQHEVDTPLLDQSQPAEEKGQRCCVIF